MNDSSYTSCLDSIVPTENCPATTTGMHLISIVSQSTPATEPSVLVNHEDSVFRVSFYSVHLVVLKSCMDISAIAGLLMVLQERKV